MIRKKSKFIYGILALILGDFGIHQFYLKNYKRGVVYLIFSWTYIPYFFAIYDLIKINRSFAEYERKCLCNGVIDNFNINDLTQDYKEIREDFDKSSVYDKRKSNLNEQFTYPNNIINKHKFYNEEEIILDKYKNCITPQSIIDSVHKEIYKKNNDWEFAFEIETKESRFIKDSIKYRDVIGNECVFMPLMCYWTTFQDLDEQQKKWYFYWRQCVLRGEYIDTDLSYIFLFVYELLNYSFNESAAFNISMIERICEAYSDRYSKLEKYLKPWINDFLYELGIEEKYKEDYYFENKMYKILQDNKESIDRISITSWRDFIRYNETKFFSFNKNKIYKAFKKNMMYLNSFYIEKGTSIFDVWFTPRKEKSYIRLFRSAVIAREVQRDELEYTRHEPNARMFNEVTQIFRLTENIVRCNMNENRKIKVEYEWIPEGFEEYLNIKLEEASMNERVMERFKKVKDKEDNINVDIPKRAIQTKSEYKSEIEFNDGVINDVSNEGDNFIELFNEEYGEDESDDLNVEQMKKKGENTLEHIFSESDIFSDNNSFINELSDLEKRFISKFENLEINIPIANTFGKENGVMTSILVDGINEKSLKFLDDTFIELEDEKYTIYEEYSDIVKQLGGVIRFEN